jgi:DNA-binding MarR family transcriptional regulator
MPFENNQWRDYDGSLRAHEQTPTFRLPDYADESLDTTLQMSVRRARQLRLLRKRIFVGNGSGPGWDILLYLYESHLSQVRDTAGSVCKGAELASSTGVRWMSSLESDELISSIRDGLDARRRKVELTDKAVRLMTSYFAGAAPHKITA